MATEIEVRFLDIDEKKFIKKLEKLRAEKIGDWLQVRYVYDFKDQDPNKQKWIRLRTNGETSTLTIKEIHKNTIDGTDEIEVAVSNFHVMAQIMEQLGYIPRGRQENKRKRYILDGVEIDIDEWPSIPPYVEIEGKCEKSIKATCEKLGLNYSKAITMGVQDIMQKIYNWPKDKHDCTFS